MALASKPIIIDPLTIAIAEFGLILALLAFPAYQLLKSTVKKTRILNWLRWPVSLIGSAATVTMALPLYVIASFHLYAGRHFLKAGELQKIGIETTTAAAPSRTKGKAKAKRRRPAKEAA